jgi:hypothetical protein
MLSGTGFAIISKYDEQNPKMKEFIRDALKRDEKE